MTSMGKSAAKEGGVVPKQAVIERITVALIPKAGQDLKRLQDRTDMSKTDIVNRAITLYEFFEARQREGHDVLLKNKETGETQTILFL